MFPIYKPICKTCDAGGGVGGGGHFWQKGHNMNRLGIGPLGDATCTYKMSRL